MELKIHCLDWHIFGVYLFEYKRHVQFVNASWMNVRTNFNVLHNHHSSIEGCGMDNGKISAGVLSTEIFYRNSKCGRQFEGRRKKSHLLFQNVFQKQNKRVSTYTQKKILFLINKIKKIRPKHKHVMNIQTWHGMHTQTHTHTNKLHVLFHAIPSFSCDAHQHRIQIMVENIRYNTLHVSIWMLIKKN